MTEYPLFSIVIPTKDRPHTFVYSLKSALWQDFDNYEIIVCDNSSDDKVKEIVDNTGNRKVKYIKAPGKLYLNELWDYAITFANGRYVSILDDDDVYIPAFLSKMAKIINNHDFDIFSFQKSLYYSDSWPDSYMRNLLYVPVFSRRICRFSGRKFIKQLYKKCGDLYFFPAFLLSVYRRELLMAVKNKVGRLFHSHAFDIFASVALLSQTNEFIFIDIPFLIKNKHKDSLSTSVRMLRSNNIEYIKERIDINNFLNNLLVPLPIITLINARVQALLELKKIFKKELGNYNLNWVDYFLKCYSDIILLKRYGTDVESDMEVFWQTIQKLPISMQNKIKKQITTLLKVPEYNKCNTLNIKNFIFGSFDKLSVLLRIENFIREMLVRDPRPYFANRFIKIGESFDNILVCAKQFSRILNQYMNSYL